MILFAKAATLLSALAASAVGYASAERTFTDAKGIKHATTKDKPKIVTFAHRAVSLRHYGKCIMFIVLLF